MHLGINVVRLTRQFTGVGRYMECLLHEWSRRDLPFERVTLLTHTPLEQDRLHFPLDRFAQRVVGKPLPDPLWESRYLPRAAGDVDVLFGPSYTLPVGWKGKSVVSYMGPSEFTPGTYAWCRSQVYEMLYRHSAHRAQRVLAPSQAVKKRVVEAFALPEEKVAVTYMAASDLFRPLEDAELPAAAALRYAPRGEPIILFVGKLARRHAIPNLLQAFARLKADRAVPHRLLLVGPDYLGLNVPRRAARLGIGDAVQHVDYLNHRDLVPLYNAAQFVVYPSTWAEGFGIPVTEAMACGTPVLTVNRGALPEVATNAALLIESSSVDDLCAGMRRIINDPQLRADLKVKGLARAKQFTWHTSAEQTMNVLWETATGSKSSRVGCAHHTSTQER